MSAVLCTLRSHFFKHLSYNAAAIFVSVHPRSHHHRSPAKIFSLAEAKRQWNLTTNIATFSTSSTSASLPDSERSESFTSPYLSVRISCPNHLVDLLSEALLCFGASSASFDQEDWDKNSDEICISLTFPVHHNVSECISHATNSIGLEDVPYYVVEMLDHTDWIRKTQESFYPVKVLEGLWVVPEWRTPPDLQATNIILNPGFAFGTGEHPTTKLCLSLLHCLIKGGEVFLDYGTGSGILAIAALKFGAALSVGVDIDPQAITSAQHNAALNKIEPEKLHLHLIRDKASSPDVEVTSNDDLEIQNWHGMEKTASAETFDVIIANILLNPVLDLAEQIVSHAKPGAVIGVSGIISEQVSCVLERYSQFLEGITVSKMDNWACISGTKKCDLTGS